jgi:2-polyprenyl-3-methyl-5-hydroxy-6-metoxy-1,4-benzoquinol methylase
VTRLITPEYVRLNQALHARGDYGISGSRWAPTVSSLCAFAGSRDVLDYGCGQGTLGQALGFPVRQYDPCIAGLDAAPQPADIVACTDVLEHIEPECLDGVLDDLKRVTKRYAFLVIATRPAEKVLPDGRNAHLIQEPWAWWHERIAARFQVREVKEREGEFAVVVQALSSPPSPRNP